MRRLISHVAATAMPFARPNVFFKSLPYLTILVWLVFSVPRIGSLGFYYGDSWATIVAISHGHYHSYGSLESLLIQFAPKPVGIFTHLVWVWIAGDSALLWQASLALACLLGAYLLYLFLRGLRDRSGARYDLTSDFCAALWLTAPLDLGATILPNMFNALLGQAMFFAFALRLLRVAQARNLEMRELLIAMMWLLGSYLSYESYYFQFVAVVGTIYLFATPAVSAKRCALLMAATTFVQALCIGYNRVVGLIDPARVGSKTFNSAWRDTLNFESIKATFTHNLSLALGDLTSPIVYCLLVLAVTALAAALLQLFCRDWKPLATLGASVLLYSCAYLLCVTIYALAAYGMSYLGVESRVAMTPKYIYALCIFAALVTAQKWRLTQVAAFGSSGVLLILLGLLSRELSRPWKVSWDLQQQVLEELRSHETELAQLTPTSRVVFIGPYYVGPAPVFQADIQLSVAVKEQVPRFQEWPGVNPYFLSGYGGHIITWNGDELMQQAERGQPHRVQAEDVWIWNFYEKTFRRMQVNEKVDPKALGAYLSDKF